MKIDFEKYGFVLIRETEDDFMKFYERVVGENPKSHAVVGLAITFDNVVTVEVDHYDSFGEWSSRLMVANRYKVETQEQFDFLILNGRVGWIFKTKNK